MSTAKVGIAVGSVGWRGVVTGTAHIVEEGDVATGVGVVTPPPLTQEVLDSEGESLIFSSLFEGDTLVDVGAQVPCMEDSGPPSKR